jgi:N-acetyl-gamma-glutamyl-phosphate reductase
MLDDGVKVIDVSADFRLKNSSEYKEWYGIDHPCPEYLDEAVYGLTELNRNMVSSARLVANPGCYPTASILALAPAIQAGIVKPDIVVDAKSGVSGAGRGKYPFADTNENLMAYSVTGHRHMPEIKQELNKLDDSVDLNITFLTHLVPMNRGLLASCYAPINYEKVSGSDINSQISTIYEDFYGKELFVQISDSAPMTKNTLGTNNCMILPTVDLRSNRLIVVSCIDNLIKGAAGQAIQNMNLMFGLPEDMGLNGLALYP